MKCEVHENCDKPVVAKIGLPSIHAKWACEDGFNEFRVGPRCNSFIGGSSRPDTLQCTLRLEHEGEHIGSNGIRWSNT